MMQCGGYEFEFVQGVDADGDLEDMFMCKICHLPSRDAQLSVCCGHTFCKSCLNGMKHGSSKCCPVCREDKNFGVVPNKQVDRKIRSLKVFCTNKEKGCKWHGELNDIKNHLNASNSDGCKYESIECDYGCGNMVQRQHLVQHMTTECSHRKVDCQHCNLSGIYGFITGIHEQECPKVLIPCPNHCEDNAICREDMDEHRKVCPLEVVSCKYMKAGCETRMARQDVERHGKEKVEEHLCLAMDRLEKLENVVSQLVWSSDLASKASSGSKVAPIVVKVTGLSNKRNKKRHWRSPNIYTENRGYEIYTEVTFDDSYLKVFVSFENNKKDYLQWPFRGRLDMAILNQISDSEHCSRSLIYDDECSDDIAGKDAKYSWGFSEFVSYDQLYTVSSTCQYVKDDSMYMKVSYFGLKH